LTDVPLTPAKVVLPLKQHAGAPAQATVRVGERVSVGDVIARPAKDALGAVIHASLAGVVGAVGDSIVIEAAAQRRS
jgi:Na+-translocating ferredoxin:NAD+ oxidoreductase RnfC subunit